MGKDTRDPSREKAKTIWRRLGILFLNFLLLYGLLRLIIKLGEENVRLYYIGSGAYLLAFCVLFVFYFLWNGGTFGRFSPTMEELPADWDDDTRRAYLEKVARGREKAKTAAYVLLPMALSIFISYVELWWIR